jgi:hypothetical protein
MNLEIKFYDEIYHVTGKFHPASKGVYYSQDGDGTPDESADFDFHQILIDELDDDENPTMSDCTLQMSSDPEFFEKVIEYCNH